jgi:hypothetical protein
LLLLAEWSVKLNCQVSRKCSNCQQKIFISNNFNKY